MNSSRIAAAFCALIGVTLLVIANWNYISASLTLQNTQYVSFTIPTNACEYSQIDSIVIAFDFSSLTNYFCAVGNATFEDLDITTGQRVNFVLIKDPLVPTRWLMPLSSQPSLGQHYFQFHAVCMRIPKTGLPIPEIFDVDVNGVYTFTSYTPPPPPVPPPPPDIDYLYVIETGLGLGLLGSAAVLYGYGGRRKYA